MTLADRDLLDAPAPHRWTFDDYMRAAEAGIFDSQPVELIEGELIDMPAQKELTAWIISRLVGKLDSVFPEPYWIKIKATQRLSNFTAPEPDVTILSGPPCPPAAEPPMPLLIIEVSDTTPVWDQTTKASLYASYGISDYWVIDANLKQVEVFRGPNARRVSEIRLAIQNKKRFQFKRPHRAVVQAGSELGSLGIPELIVRG